MRLPAYLLESAVTVQTIATTGPRGSGLSTPVSRRAHVEENHRLVIDQRTTSETAGQVIPANTLVIMQLEHHVPVGSIITTTDGEAMTVMNGGKRQGARVPEHSELWCV